MNLFYWTGKVYTVQVLVKEAPIHYVGWKWEARMVEMFVECTVDGIKGRGTSEWNYHHTGGRPDSVAASDPGWFRGALKEYVSTS